MCGTIYKIVYYTEIMTIAVATQDNQEALYTPGTRQQRLGGRRQEASGSQYSGTVCPTIARSLEIIADAADTSWSSRNRACPLEEMRMCGQVGKETSKFSS